MDNNKILIEVYIPSLEREFDIFIPVSKRVGTIKKLIEKGIKDFAGDGFSNKEDTNLYSKETGLIYDVNLKVIDTDLKNGSRVILI
mgnify:CR=1 FL=1